LIVARIGVRGFFHLIRRTHNDETERILIYGADMNSIMIKQVLDSSNDSKYHVVGFLGTNETSRGGSVHIQQKKVFAVNELTKLKNKYRVTNLIITNDDLSASHKKMVLDKCFDLGIKIMTVPPSSQWIYGRLRLRQIQDLKIEDLLQREPIKISDVHIFEELSGKRVLVTGAGGSIGSEIVRQILRYHPSTLVLCDQAESDLYDIQLEAEEDYPHINIKTHIASIRNLTRMHVPFREFRPQFVFHAAAYKHVPMMENHPSEAILTNVLGTKHIAELSMQYKVQKFVMISTDKAVNPTNIMGASKRIAEMFVQSLNDPDDPLSTKFMTTRFGNVLDSNGSVIPRFRSQIQNGGPVTVTHPDIVRYFMTIPEAVQLVLEACAMGKGGEIFIFDMGKPVRIYDLATNMIKLAGLIPGKDIDIQITGLRPGEKLFEELLNDGEKTIPTHHDKIKIARVITYPKEKVHGNIMELLGISRRDESNALVRKMKEIVPEFKSKNSPYEILDVPVHG
jgi:FlaA1/EpsC-like NDP-sugar epimerase